MQAGHLSLGSAADGRSGASYEDDEIVGGAAAFSGPLPVLLLSSDPDFVARLHQGLAGSREVLLLHGHVPHATTSLEMLAAAHQAGVVVVDASLVDGGPIDATPRDSHGPELILVFEEVTRPALDAVLRTHARGCIEPDIEVPAFVQAVQSVADGELWLPRWMLEIVYEHALAGSAVQPPAEPHGHAKNELTDREAQVLRLVRRGMTNKEVAHRLDISTSTVKKHLHNALAKRGLFRRRQAYE